MGEFQAKLAAIKLENEKIRQQILKEVLMQNKIDTATKRHRALQSGVDLSHL